MPLPRGQDPAGVRCGFVTVPENRSRPEGPTVRLAVAVLEATGPSPAEDPIVDLGSGLGPVLDRSMQRFTADFARPLQTSRDLVFVDQRGSGRSEPRLDCPEHRLPRDDYGENQSIELDTDRHVQELLACHDRLVREGRDLSGYTTRSLAADIVDVMRALGYRSWNVYGFSQTTRMAQILMRDFGNEIRSVVLDAPIPLAHVHLVDLAANFERTVALIARDCAADARCARVFPDFERQVYELIPDLNASPLVVAPIDAATGDEFRVVFTGDHLVQIAALALQDSSLIPVIPFLALLLEQRETSIVTAAAAQLAAPAAPEGMIYSILCEDQVPSLPPAEALARHAEALRPEVWHVFAAGEIDRYRRVCDGWGGIRPHVESEPITSDIPTLMMVGEYDVPAPPRYAEMIGARLSRSFRFEFRGYGHGVLYSFAAPTGPPSCPMQLVAQFIEDPNREPDGSCVAAVRPPSFAGT
jgi:pimeloyl-ACP methyl ester carboxylesterase